MKKPAKLTPNLLLKRARERKGWSQEHVAQEVGTDAFTVSRWERGVTMPSPHFREKLCALFGLNAPDLGFVPMEADAHIHQTAGRSTIAPFGQTPIQATVLDPAIPPAFTQGHGLVGRDELLRQLKQQLLTGGHVALSAFNGLPGVGKTALATALAHDEEVRAHFVDGVLWAGLGHDPDVLGLLGRWGTLLDAAPFELAQRSWPEAWAARIHAAIGQRRLLLVIDDIWDIGHALALQVGGPHCTHLITTRFPEIARRFAPEGAIVVRELEETDGRLLLMRLAPEVVKAEPEEAQALVTAVGGLPLALTLLGNYLRAQAHSGQPRRLRAALERLRSAGGRLQLAEPQALVGGHPSLSAGTPLSLQAVIGISEQQVSEEARVTLRTLAVFPPKPNTFSEEAAVAVSDLPVETLDELTDAGLLESSGPERYTLHQTIADYARTHLADERAPERLVAYFVPYVEVHATDYTVLERESSNIVAALEAAYERGMQAELVRGVHAFEPFLETRGQYALAEAHEQQAEEAARALGDIAGQATARLRLGRLAWQQAQPQQAHHLLEEALVLSRQAGDRRNEGSALRNLGILARERGQPETARQLYEEALVALREVGDESEVASTLNNMGVLARQQGQPEHARQLLEEALAMFRQVGDQSGTANTLGNLGRIAENQGKPELAIQLYQESLAMFRQLTKRRSTAQVLHNLGTIVWQQGQPESARKLYEEALDIFQQIGDRRIFALTLTELGVLERMQEQLEQAQQHLQEARDILLQLKDRREVAVALRELGALARQQEQPAEAYELLGEALSTFRHIEDRREVARTLKELGILARGEKQWAQAKQYLDETLAMLLSLGDPLEVALTRQELGVLARQQGELEQAHLLLTLALASLRQLHARRNVAQTLKELGMLAQEQGHAQEALPLLLSAGVGMGLVDSPEAVVVEKLFKQVRAELGENAFLTGAKRAAKETPEAAYEMEQAAWVAAIRKLVTGRVGV